MSDAMHRAHVVAIRKRLGLTQAQMAERLGLSLRTWNTIETGASPCRRIHVLAAERVESLETKP